MPPAASASANNNNNNNNAAQAAKAEREERLREALKAFILKERQRKKEEFEAKVEEERLRKEREARERQNDMTLEETRRQIAKLDQKLTELRNQKQQLFLQLKKVLNEDENRKKQQKDNEMFAMQALQAQQANVPPPQVFIPPVRVQHHQMPILPKPAGNQPIKRGRTPSPPSHQGYYKSTNYTQPKHDDGRRGADYARVLWNKPPTQYQNPGTLFYQTTSNAPPSQQPPPDTRGPTIIYPAYNLPLRQGYHLELQPNSAVPVSKTDPQQSQKQQQQPTQVYHINLDQPPISQTSGGAGSANPGSGGGGGGGIMQSQKPQVTMEKINDQRYHVEVKHESGPSGHGPSPHQLSEGVVYTPLISGMPLHPNVMQISGGQNPKSGPGIAQGYSTGRGAASAHEQQMVRQQQQQQQQQQQMSAVMQGQPRQQQQQQQLHYPQRSLF